jgi:hypothetical protein
VLAKLYFSSISKRTSAWSRSTRFETLRFVADGGIVVEYYNRAVARIAPWRSPA